MFHVLLHNLTILSIMPGPGLFYSIMQTDLENMNPVEGIPIRAYKTQSGHSLCTSEKIRYMLRKFPSSKPRATSFAPIPVKPYGNICTDCFGSNCTLNEHWMPSYSSNTVELMAANSEDTCGSESMQKDRNWTGEVIQTLQLAVASTALILYYIIYCWMQLVYNAVRIVLFFHNADLPMKITLGVVAVASLVLGFNVLMRVQKLYYSVLR